MTPPVAEFASAARAADLPATDGFVVLDACHQDTMRMAGALRELAESLQFQDADDAARARAREIERFFSTTARLHHEDEEHHVFPSLLATGSADIVQAVLRLQQDHGWLEEDWLEIAPHLQALGTGYGVCDVDLLRAGAEVFEALYRDHIELEESYIYPEARASLGRDQREAMGREMAARRRAARGG